MRIFITASLKIVSFQYNRDRSVEGKEPNGSNRHGQSLSANLFGDLTKRLFVIELKSAQEIRPIDDLAAVNCKVASVKRGLSTAERFRMKMRPIRNSPYNSAAVADLDLTAVDQSRTERLTSGIPRIRKSIQWRLHRKSQTETPRCSFPTTYPQPKWTRLQYPRTRAMAQW